MHELNCEHLLHRIGATTAMRLTILAFSNRGRLKVRQESRLIGLDPVVPSGLRLILSDGHGLTPMATSCRRVAAENGGRVAAENGGRVAAENGGRVAAENGGRVAAENGGRFAAGFDLALVGDVIPLAPDGKHSITRLPRKPTAHLLMVIHPFR